jgi:hypothetical protein
MFQVASHRPLQVSRHALPSFLRPKRVTERPVSHTAWRRFADHYTAGGIAIQPVITFSFGATLQPPPPPRWSRSNKGLRKQSVCSRGDGVMLTTPARPTMVSLTSNVCPACERLYLLSPAALLMPFSWPFQLQATLQSTRPSIFLRATRGTTPFPVLGARGGESG